MTEKQVYNVRIKMFVLDGTNKCISDGVIMKRDIVLPFPPFNDLVIKCTDPEGSFDISINGISYDIYSGQFTCWADDDDELLSACSMDDQSRLSLFREIIEKHKSHGWEDEDD